MRSVGSFASASGPLAIAHRIGFAVRHQLLDQVGQRLEEEWLEKFTEKTREEQRAYSGDRP